MNTQIICTIGPKTDNEKMIEKLARNGMSVMRNNFAHCTFDEYKRRLKTLREINKKLGTDVQIQVDLRGPIIRLGGDIPEEGIEVKNGQTLTFVTCPCKDIKPGEIVIDDPYLHADVKKGEPVLIASGALELVITKTRKESHKFDAKVIRGGIIYPRKGVNLPTTKLTTSSLTEKDLKDINFVLKNGVDIIAMSFVGSADDIYKIKKIIGNRPVKVWAKIERKEALVNIDSIIEASDGIIIARGDLGVEIPFEEVPIMQKMIIKKCHQRLKPVVVATQMLTSMIKSPFPTRAEVSDIANAIFDGAHAVWLSDETTSGDYPIDALKVMKRVADKTDTFLETYSI